MKNITKYDKQKATICSNNICVTVYDETAKVVNTIVIGTLLLVGIALVGKAFK